MRPDAPSRRDSLLLPDEAEFSGVTELRVYGASGTPPAAVDGDLAAQQASGNRVAGIYRIADHHASSEDKQANRDIDRHVEVYMSGGQTFNSKSRAMWLALLPFLLSNMAGWMCTVRTRRSRWRFRLHRLAFGLGALALTVNTSLVTVMITVDLLAYQVPRAGLAGSQWWTAPLRWPGIADHPARQVLVGMVAAVLLLLVLVEVIRKSFRYEDVRPPYRVEDGQDMARMVTAAALNADLADDEFWDGGPSVRLLTAVHVAAAAGFLAIVLSVIATALTATGSPHVLVLGQIAIGLGAASIALGGIYICLDALVTPAAAVRSRVAPAAIRLRYLLVYPLAVLAITALITSGVFAWLVPVGPTAGAAELPGMAEVIGWTALAIAVPLTAALISTLLGLSGGRGGLLGGPWVTLVLAFSVLNTAALGAGIAAAHLVGPVTSNAATALSDGMIYLPYLIATGVPLAALTALAAGVAFTLTEFLRRLRTRQLPDRQRMAYWAQDDQYVKAQPDRMKSHYRSAVRPFGDRFRGDSWVTRWERKVARAQLRGGMLFNAGWLIWGIIIGQLVMILCTWRLHWLLPAFINKAGVVIASLALPARIGFLFTNWRSTAQRSMTTFWDIATFWPRSYHPFSPPCYAEGAVPALQHRMWLLHDRDRQLVLAAHGQGAMIATAALVQPGHRPGDDHPTLVTFGSTVGKLYGWGFPAYVTQELESLKPGGPGRLNAWHNLYYRTDLLGGPVAEGLRSSVEPVNWDLPDPAHSWYIYGEDPPTPRGHSGYWDDPRVLTLINKAAAEARSIQVTAGGRPDGAASHLKMAEKDS